MTDKMSVAHEIEYSIFVYLAAAGNGTTVGENSNTTLDEKAPEIMGLEYQSETELEYAEYFKIYHYDQGIVLLEVDMTKDTARDPEKTSKETFEDTEKEVSKSDKKDSTENKSSKSDAAEEESGDFTSDQNGVSEEELAAELAAERMDEEGKAKLDKALQEFEVAIESGDNAAIADSDMEFHDIIFDATGNPRLIQIISNLREQFYRYRLEYVKDTDYHIVLLNEHKELVNAIESGKKEEARQIMKKHITNQEMTVIRNIKEEY